MSTARRPESRYSSIRAEQFHRLVEAEVVVPYRRGLAGPDALRAAIEAFWATYAEHRGVLIGVFQASIVDPQFRVRWLSIRQRAIAHIVTEIRHTQREGYCPGMDPHSAAAGLQAMLEHYCYVWHVHDGELAAASTGRDDRAALDTLATLCVQSIYWRPGPVT